MSLKQRKQQDCQLYLDYWNKCQAKIEDKEKALLLESKRLVEEFQSERGIYYKGFLPDALRGEIRSKEAIVKRKKDLILELKNKDKDIFWPFFVAALIAMVVAYSLGYDHKNIMPK